MARQNPVQSKMPCVFETGVFNAPSMKRQNQSFKVTASQRLRPEIVPHDLECATATEKLDGTCCLIQEYQGLSWLWPRLDRKPNKAGDKKFQRHQAKVQAWSATPEEPEPPTMVWDHRKDFKDVPETWIPASGLDIVDGVVQPDKLGHTPGWLPVERGSRQYMWHLSAVDLDLGIALVLTPGGGHDGSKAAATHGDQVANGSEGDNFLVLRCLPLADLLDKTCELIGTNINGNPYGLGSKKQPLHFLVPHGSLPIACPSPLDPLALHIWFKSINHPDSVSPQSPNQDKDFATEAGIAQNEYAKKSVTHHQHQANGDSVASITGQNQDNASVTDANSGECVKNADCGGGGDGKNNGTESEDKARGDGSHRGGSEGGETVTDGAEGFGSNRVEGVVWHCPSGALYKLHRHHLELPWPVPSPHLSQQPVRVEIDTEKYGIDTDKASIFARLATANGKTAEKLCEINAVLEDGR